MEYRNPNKRKASFTLLVLLLGLCWLLGGCTDDMPGVPPPYTDGPLTRVSMEGTSLAAGDSFTLLVYRKALATDHTYSVLYAVSSCTVAATDASKVPSGAITTTYSHLAGTSEGLELPNGSYRLCAVLPVTTATDTIPFDRGADLLVAVKDLNLGATTTGEVEVDWTEAKFIHQSSLVQFRVVHQDTTRTDAIHLQKLTLSNLSAKGKCTPALSDTLPYKTLVLPADKKDQSFAITPQGGTFATNAAADTVTTYPFLLIPGTFANVGVTVELQTDALGEETVSLNGAMSTFTFEPGRYYMFTLHVDKPGLTCTVEKWTPGGATQAITADDHGEPLFTVDGWSTVTPNPGNLSGDSDPASFTIGDWLTGASSIANLIQDYGEMLFTVYAWGSSPLDTATLSGDADRFKYLIQEWLTGGTTLANLLQDYGDFSFSASQWTGGGSATGTLSGNADKTLFSVTGWTATDKSSGTPFNDLTDAPLKVTTWTPAGSKTAALPANADKPHLDVNDWGTSANGSATPLNDLSDAPLKVNTWATTTGDTAPLATDADKPGFKINPWGSGGSSTSTVSKDEVDKTQTPPAP